MPLFRLGIRLNNTEFSIPTIPRIKLFTPNLLSWGSPAKNENRSIAAIPVKQLRGRPANMDNEQDVLAGGLVALLLTLEKLVETRKKFLPDRNTRT